MTERDYDERNLEQRLRDHYRRRYARSLDPTLIWEHVQPYLDQQQDTPSEPMRREKWLADLPGFLAFRRKEAFMHEREEGLVKSAYEEQTSEAPILDPSSAQRPLSLRPRVQHAIEAVSAIALVASLIIGWLAIAHTLNSRSQGTNPSLFTYTSQQGENVHSLQWTPDGKYLVFSLLKTAMDHYRFLVWNAATGKVEQTLSFTLTPETSSRSGSSLAISPDGRYVLIIIPGIPGKMGTIALANVLTGHIEQIYQVHGDKGNLQVAFSNDSKYVALLGDDERIHTWNIAAGKFTLISDPLGVSAAQIAWWQDGKSIVIESFPSGSGQPRTLQIWNAFTGHKIESIVETPTMWFVSPLALTAGLSPDLQRILMYNQQAMQLEVRVTRTLKVLLTFHFQLLDYAQISPSGFLEASSGPLPFWLADGKLIFLQKDSQVYVWKATTGRIFLVASNAVLETQKGTSGQYAALLLGKVQGRVLDIWDLITAAKVRTIVLTSHPTDIQWLHDSRYLNVTYGGEKENSVSELYDAFTGELITTYQGDHAELSSDGKYIASEDNVPDPHNKNGDVLDSLVKVQAFP